MPFGVPGLIGVDEVDWENSMRSRHETRKVTECVQQYLRVYYGPKTYPYPDHTHIETTRFDVVFDKEEKHHPSPAVNLVYRTFYALTMYRYIVSISEANLALELIREQYDV